MSRTSAIIQNSQNALSYLLVQDSSLAAAGKIVDRMAELRTMAQDITKNTGDIENYSKEFIELQSQLNQISKEKFNELVCSESNATAISEVMNIGQQVLVACSTTHWVVLLQRTTAVQPTQEAYLSMW